MIKKIIYNSGAQLIGKIFQILTSIITVGLLTRHLGPDGYGQYTLIMASTTLLVALGNWGSQIIGVRELSTSKEKSKLFSSLLFLRLILAGIVIGLGSVFILTSPIFKNIRQLGLISLILAFNLITESSFTVIFQSFLKMERKTLINIVSSFIFLGLTLVFLKLNYKILAPLLSWLITRIISIIISYFLSKKLLPWKWSPQKKMVKKLFYQSLPLGTLLVLSTSYDQAIDSFFIRKFLGDKELGFYGLSYKIYSNLVLPAYFLNNSLFPLLSKKSNFKKILKTGIKLSLIGLFALVPLTYFFAPDIIPILGGGEFLSSTKLLRILSFALIFAYLNHLSGFSLIALGKQKISLKIGVVGLIWNLALNFYLIPQFGTSAAAWITVSTECLTAILSSFILLKILKNIDE